MRNLSLKYLLLTTVHTVKSKGKNSKNFVAFSEYMNFMVKIVLYFMTGLDWKARTRAGKYQMNKAFLISHKIQRRKTCLKTFRKEILRNHLSLLLLAFQYEMPQKLAEGLKIWGSQQ